MPMTFDGLSEESKKPVADTAERDALTAEDVARLKDKYAANPRELEKIREAAGLPGKEYGASLNTPGDPAPEALQVTAFDDPLGLHAMLRDTSPKNSKGQQGRTV